MSTNVTDTGTPLSDHVAEEIRALLGRKRMSQAKLARELGVSAMWINYRLNGIQEIGLNDLQRIADALDVPWTALLPERSGTATAKNPATPTGQGLRDNRLRATHPVGNVFGPNSPLAAGTAGPLSTARTGILDQITV